MSRHRSLPGILSEDEDSNIQYSASDVTERTSLLHNKPHTPRTEPSYKYISCRWFCATPARFCNTMLLFSVIAFQAILAGLSWLPTHVDTRVWISSKSEYCLAAPSSNSTSHLPFGGPASVQVHRCAALPTELYNVIAAALLVLTVLVWWSRKWFIQTKVEDFGSHHPCNSKSATFWGIFALPLLFLAVTGWAIIGWILSARTGVIAFGISYGKTSQVYTHEDNPFVHGAPYNGTPFARVVAVIEASIMSIVALILWAGLFGGCCGCARDYLYAGSCGDLESHDCSYASAGVSCC